MWSYWKAFVKVLTFQGNKNAIKYSLHSSKKSIFISESSTWIQCSILCLKKKCQCQHKHYQDKCFCFCFNFWLCWVFVAVPVFLELQHVGFSLRWLLCWSVLALEHMSTVAAALGLLSTGSVVVMNALSCPMVCGTFPDQGSNLCLLQWQADSLPLSHQEGPKLNVFYLYEKPHKDNT